MILGVVIFFGLLIIFPRFVGWLFVSSVGIGIGLALISIIGAMV